MNITRWDPFSDMEEIMKQYNRSLAKHPSHEGMLRADWAPAVDITENDKEFLIKAELPEVKKEDINIDVNNGILTLSGERYSETRDEKKHRIERSYGSFSRSFSLPDNVNESGISAESKDGMLYLHLPKTEAEKPKKIKVHIK